MTRRRQSGTESILKHWREAVPDDRLAHLVKDATRALLRALQMRLTTHDVSLGHWTFLRILWEKEGLTQRELSEEAGVMEPTTFSALNAMEKLGYITRRHMPDNRRKVSCLSHAERPASSRQAGAARRGREPRRRDGCIRGSDRGDPRDAARHHRKSGPRRCSIRRSGAPYSLDARACVAGCRRRQAPDLITSAAKPRRRTPARTEKATPRSCPPCCAALQRAEHHRHRPTRSERRSRQSP